jgi:hypothetical protein
MKKKHQTQPRQHGLLRHRKNKQQPPYTKTDARGFIVAASDRVLSSRLVPAFCIPRPPTDTHLTVSPPSWPLMRPVPHASPLEVTAAKKTKTKGFPQKTVEKKQVIKPLLF